MVPTQIRPRPQAIPVWHQPGEIALYPLRGAALLTVLVLTVFGVLAWLPGAGWLLSIVAYFSGYHYAFEILLRTANGRSDPPAVTIDAQNGAVWRLLGLLLVLLAGIQLAFHTGWGWAGMLALAAFAFQQPCLLASLATGEGLPAALNPANALRMMGRIGGTYLVVSAALFLIQSSALLAASALAPVLPGFFAALLVDLVFYWGLFASFHLLGRVMYQYHEQLGYTPSWHTDALPTLQDRDQALLDRAALHVDDNDLPAAIALLREEIGERAVTPAVHARYRQLLRRVGDTEALEAHAGRCIAMLAQNREERPALGLLREALDANPAFSRLDPEHGEWLAKRALDLGQFRLAADALRALLRADPRHPNAVEWARQAARLLHERFGETAAARATLRSARDGCRDDTGASQLDAALQALPLGTDP